MKKIFNSLMILVIGGVSFTSCLGDTESSSSYTNQFGYVTVDENGRKVVAFTDLYLSHSSLDEVSIGDCILADVKYKLNNGGKAEYINIHEKYPKSLHISVTGANVDTTALASPRNAFDKLSLPIGWWHFDSMGNKALMAYSFMGLEDEPTPDIEVFYDSEKQCDLKGEPLGKMERIIDIRMTRKEGGKPETEKSRTKKLVLDLSMFKTTVKNELIRDDLFKFPEGTYAIGVHVRYRIHLLTQDRKKSELQISSKNDSFQLGYLKENN